MTEHNRTTLVGVAGGSASGKGTIVDRLLVHYGKRASVLRMDDYYRPIGQIPRDADGEPNFDEPGSLDLERLAGDLDRLRAGEDLHIDSYTFNQPGFNRSDCTSLLVQWFFWMVCFCCTMKVSESGCTLPSISTPPLKRVWRAGWPGTRLSAA